VYVARGELDKAVADFTEALRWQPPDAPRQAHLYLSRSDALMRAQREAEAAADLQKVLELTPKDPLPFNNLAQLYANGTTALRDAKKALALARRGLQVAPGHWYCRNTLGVAHYRLGEYTEAVVALERSLRESKGERAAFQLYFLAMCYARLGDAAKAHECYEQAARWEPEHPERLPPNWRERLKGMAAEADTVLAEKVSRWPKVTTERRKRQFLRAHEVGGRPSVGVRPAASFTLTPRSAWPLRVSPSSAASCRAPLPGTAPSGNGRMRRCVSARWRIGRCQARSP
jgi:tetratricopeptide (TPR) repeat protein